MYSVMLSYGLKLHKGVQLVVKPPRNWRYFWKQLKQSQVTVGTFVPRDDPSLWRRVTGLKFFVAIEGPDPTLKALPGSNAMGIQAYDHNEGTSQYKAEVVRLRLGKQPRKRRWVQQEDWQGETWAVESAPTPVEVELEPLEQQPSPPRSRSSSIPTNGYVVEPAVRDDDSQESVRPRRVKFTAATQFNDFRRTMQRVVEGELGDVRETVSRFLTDVPSNGVVMSPEELTALREETAAQAKALEAAEAAERDRADHEEESDEFEEAYYPNLPSNGYVSREDDTAFEDDPVFEDAPPAADVVEPRLDVFEQDEPAIIDDRFADDDYADDDDDDFEDPVAVRPRYTTTRLPSNGYVMSEDDDEFDDDEFEAEDQVEVPRSREYRPDTEAAAEPVADFDDEEFEDDDDEAYESDRVWHDYIEREPDLDELDKSEIPRRVVYRNNPWQND